MFRHILIPTDGSLLSAAAVESGVAFARDAGARVTVLAVVEPYHVWWADTGPASESEVSQQKDIRDDINRHLVEAERKAKEQGVPCTVLQVAHEHPYRAIIDMAKKSGCDLIAMASHGRRGMAALVEGSETIKVLTHSSIPVLVYR
jgi:nucleotide-binding universal stress UspA family protein